MTAIDDVFLKNFAPELAQGFALDPPEFDVLRLWTYLLYEIDFVGVEIQSLIRTHSTEGATPNNDAYLGRMYSVVTTYARIFNSGGRGVPRLKADHVFANEPGFKHAHNHLIRMRNELTAHAGNHEMLRVAIGVKEEATKYVVKRFVMPCVIPLEDMELCAQVITYTAKHIGARLDKYIVKLEAKLGKRIEVERSP